MRDCTEHCHKNKPIKHEPTRSIKDRDTEPEEALKLRGVDGYRNIDLASDIAVSIEQ